MRWIIGDIHGMLRPLTVLLEAVKRADPSPQLWFTGDYVNRGPESRGAIDLLLKIPDAQFVRGNHDDVFDVILHSRGFARKMTGNDPVAAFKWFMQHGLDTTFASYGATANELKSLVSHPTLEGIGELCRLVPESHRNFIRTLPMASEQDGFFVAHAKLATTLNLPPGWSKRTQVDPDLSLNLLWGRYTEEEIGVPKAWRGTGYFGHTPVSNYRRATRAEGNVPYRGPSIALLDTAAALGADGRLTAFNHDTQTFIQASADGRLIDARPSGD